MSAGATVFFGLWLQKPMRIAAANPSGRRFADALAGCVDFDRPGAVLELGAGTGSITRGLVRAGCPPDRIITLESEPPLAAVLRSQFPRLRVIEGDATRIDEYFPGRGERLAAVSRRRGRTPLPAPCPDLSADIDRRAASPRHARRTRYPVQSQLHVLLPSYILLVLLAERVSGLTMSNGGHYFNHDYGAEVHYNPPSISAR